MQAIYEVDRSLPIRKSHENPAIKILYEEFLEEPLSEKSHELLHTTYLARS
jgi:iron only hydrogenase large subunit-like protein